MILEGASEPGPPRLERDIPTKRSHAVTNPRISERPRCRKPRLPSRLTSPSISAPTCRRRRPVGVCVSKPDEGASATMQCIVKPTLRTQSPTQRRLTVSALPRLANLGHAVPPAAELPGANPVPALRACNCGSSWPFTLRYDFFAIPFVVPGFSWRCKSCGQRTTLRGLRAFAGFAFKQFMQLKQLAARAAGGRSRPPFPTSPSNRPSCSRRGCASRATSFPAPATS